MIIWPFEKYYSLSDYGVLDGFTECHSHILYGVDDGVSTANESLNILRTYEDLGVKSLWLTPHIMEDIPNTTASLRDRFEELKSRYRGNIELHLSAENMLDNLFMERLENNDVLPFGEKSNHLLVETTCYTPPMGLCDIMRRIKSKGYYPVIAHPERYVYMDKSDYQQLKDLGVKFQLNLLSLVGAYGKFIQKRAEYLLKGSMYDIAGSDLHKLAQCHILFESRVLSRDVVKALHLLFTQTDNSNQNIEKRTRVRKKLYAPS